MRKYFIALAFVGAMTYSAAAVAQQTRAQCTQAAAAQRDAQLARCPTTGDPRRIQSCQGAAYQTFQNRLMQVCDRLR